MNAKHKEPIAGELAIVWDMHNETAKIELYKGSSSDIKEWPHLTNAGCYSNAILFESVEQFKQFINS